MTTTWWLGPGHEKQLSPTDWAAAGVPGIIATTLWNYANGWAVDQSTLTAPQIAVLANNPEFATGKTGPRTGFAIPFPNQDLSKAEAYYVAMQQLQADMQAQMATFLSEAAVTPTSATVLANKTLTAPVINGTVTGIYTLGGTPSLTNPRIDTVRDTNGVGMLLLSPTVGAVNYFQFNNSASGSRLRLFAAGADADISIDFIPKGVGAVRVNSDTIVTLTAGQTLTNKTLSAPRMTSGILDSAGVQLLGLTATASAVNYINIISRATTVAPTIEAIGSDTDVHMVIRGQGAGRVNITNLTAANPQLTGTYALTTPRIVTALNDVNGLPLLALSPVASAANYLQLSNAVTAGSPSIQAAGTDVNIGVIIQSKGTGAVALKANGATVFQAFGTAGAVNTLYVSNALTGVDPVLASFGDTNAGLRIFPAGTGRVTVTNLSAASPIFTGQAKIIDPQINRIWDYVNNVEAFRFNAPASSVNYISTYGSITGTTTAIYAAGTDTNVDLLLSGKGTGRVNVVNLSVTTPNITSGINDANGNRILNFSPIAASVNYINIGNATGSTPFIQAAGASADVNLGLYSKGVAGIFLYDQPSNTTILRAYGVVNGVNYHRLDNSATGLPVIYSAQGTDTNISLQLQPKGSGNVLIYAATGQTPVLQAMGADANHQLYITGKGTGSVYISDDGFRVVARFLPQASAVNALQFSNSATGSSVGIAATGADTNVNMAFTTKGLGQFFFRDGSGSTMLNISNPATAVNYLGLAGAATGNGVSISAIGTDANINMGINGKGTGAIIFGSATYHTAKTAIFQSSSDYTNFERVNVGFNGTVFQIASTNSGTGTRRAIELKNHASIFVHPLAYGPSQGAVQITDDTGDPSGTILVVNGAMSASSGVQYAMAITPNFSTQTSTAGYSALLINVTDSPGSGLKFLAEFQVGSGRKFTVDNTGAVTPGKTTTAGRPTAATAGEGAMMFDTDLDIPIYSNGTIWRNAVGTAV
jgi:hypothetical protein